MMDRPLITPSSGTSIHISSNNEAMFSGKSQCKSLKKSASFSENHHSHSSSMGFFRQTTNTTASASVSPLTSPVSPPPPAPPPPKQFCNSSPFQIEVPFRDDEENSFASLPVTSNVHHGDSNGCLVSSSNTASASSSFLERLTNQSSPLPKLPSWDPDSKWILQFDHMLKLEGSNPTARQCSCICRRKSQLPHPENDNQGPSSLSSTLGYDVAGKNMSAGKASTLKRAVSMPPSRRPPNTLRMNLQGSNSAGAADEEMFIKSFEDVPEVHFSSTRELEDELNRIKDLLSEANNSDWQKRVDGLRRLRSLIKANAHEHKEFLDFIRLSELSFTSCVKDLRSSVVRESCLTIAYVSQKLGVKCARFCETLLPVLINLILNSAKIMSSSATVAIRFIIAYTRAPRLISIITYNMSSKSREIRKACCEFLDQMLHTWSTATLEKHASILQVAIKKGISDADPEARQFARKAFWGFADHFKHEADQLLQSLDPGKQKILHGESTNKSTNNYYQSVLTQVDGPPSLRPTSTASSSYSTSKQPYLTSAMSSRKPSTASSTESLNRPSSSLSNTSSIRSNIPKFAISKQNNEAHSITSTSSPLRSTSAIDTDAVRRAKTRVGLPSIVSSTLKPSATYNGTNDSLSRVNGKKTSPKSSSGTVLKDPVRIPAGSQRIPRTRSRPSQSQPGSRSSSPLSRYTAISSSSINTDSSLNGTSSGVRRRSSGIPVATSREASPNRSNDYNSLKMHDRLGAASTCISSSANGGTNRSTFKDMVNGNINHSSEKPDVCSLTEKILKQSQEARGSSNALSLANNTLTNMQWQRYNHKCNDEHSDESDTSSVCSDFSLPVRNIEDIPDIIRNLSSSKWMDRKEGLLDLLNFIQFSPRSLTHVEIKRITESLSRMLLDPLIKNHSLLFKALDCLITSYKNDLGDHIHTLLGKLFIKIGQTPLSSVISKVRKTLDLIFASFRVEIQFCAITRFLSDQTHTMNEKSRIALLHFLNKLTSKLSSTDCYSPQKHDLQLTLMKLISWTADPKSQELRKISREALLNIYLLNRQRVYTILYQLPKNYQDAAFQLIRAKKESDDKNLLTSSAILSPSTPMLQKSDMFTSSIHNRSHYDDMENLDPDEVYNSLLRTTDEIQNYRFDDLEKIAASLKESLKNSSLAPSSSSASSSEAIASKITKTKEEITPLNELNTLHSTKSEYLPSSISRSSSQQQTINNPNRIILHNVYSELAKPSPVSSSSSLNEKPSLTRVKSVLSSPISVPFSNGHQNGKTNDASTLISNLKNGLNDAHSQEYALNDLEKIIKQPNFDWNYFNDILKILVDFLNGQVKPSIKQSSLGILREFIQNKPSCFNDYIELTILNILKAYKETDRDVQRAAELAMVTASCNLPVDQCLKILKSASNSSDPLMSQAAIKMMSKLIERQDGIVIELLPEIMPPLIKACDNQECTVRKSAIFSLVEIHKKIGKKIEPYLVELKGSTLKLLELYIDRAKNSSYGQDQNNSLSFLQDSYTSNSSF